VIGNNSISLWRGALGGVLGNLAKAAIVAAGILISSTRFDGSVLFLGILGIPSAAISGLIIAIIIRVIARKIRMGIIARAATGAGLLLALGLTAYFSDVSSWSADEISTWMSASLFYIDFGLITGAVAGIMAGRKKSPELQ
jgi:hypothetical protein